MTKSRAFLVMTECRARGRLGRMGKKKVMGRPKLNPGDRKDVLLQVRMPPELVASVKAAAAKEESSVSEIVRELLEGWLRRRK